MIKQVSITLRPMTRGFHLVTNDILHALPQLPRTGLLNLFVRHTSCGIALNENCDPDVRQDMQFIFDNLVPTRRHEYLHVMEGDDDMPAHAKSLLSGVSLTIPISNGRLALGTWQGIYFCEYRDNGGPRRLLVTVMGE